MELETISGQNSEPVFLYVDSGIQLHMAIEVLLGIGFNFSQVAVIETRRKGGNIHQIRMLIRVTRDEYKGDSTPLGVLKAQNLYMDHLSDKYELAEIDRSPTGVCQFVDKQGNQVVFRPTPLTNDLLPICPHSAQKPPTYTEKCLDEIACYIERELKKNTTKALAGLALTVFLYRPNSPLLVYRLGAYGFTPTGSARPILTTIAGLLAAKQVEAYWLIERVGVVECLDKNQEIDDPFGIGLVGGFKNKTQQETAWLFGHKKGRPYLNKKSRTTVDKTSICNLAFHLLPDGSAYQEYENFGNLMDRALQEENPEGELTAQ